MNPSNNRNRKLRIKAKKKIGLINTHKKVFCGKFCNKNDNLLIAVIQKQRKKENKCTLGMRKLEITLEGRENNVSDFIINNLKPGWNGNL